MLLAEIQRLNTTIDTIKLKLLPLGITIDDYNVPNLFYLLYSFATKSV